MLDTVVRVRETVGEWPDANQYRERKRDGDPSVAWFYHSNPGGLES